MFRTVKANKRLLVLTSATGAGHDTHAHATAAWCKVLYGTAVEVRIDHTLENSHAFNRAGVDFYNIIQRNAPWSHHIYYNIIELLEMLNHGTVSFGKDYYVRLLEDFQPDAILSVHDCLNLGYFEVAREVLGSHVRCGTYCTEFGGGYGFSRNWVNPRADRIFSRTVEAADEARRRVDPQKVLVAGHWAPPPFYSSPLRDEEKARMLENMGMDPQRFTLLLSTGGAGAQNHLPILKVLLPLQNQVQVIALCGHNEAAKQQIESWARLQPSFCVKAFPFSEEMPRLLQMASAVFARAGATTAGEALLCGCPVIFNALGGIMPQEMPTWRYFKAYGVGVLAYDPNKVVTVLRHWLDQPKEYLNLRKKVAVLIYDETPKAALDSILGE